MVRDLSSYTPHLTFNKSHYYTTTTIIILLIIPASSNLTKKDNTTPAKVSYNSMPGNWRSCVHNPKSLCYGSASDSTTFTFSQSGDFAPISVFSSCPCSELSPAAVVKDDLPSSPSPAVLNWVMEREGQVLNWGQLTDGEEYILHLSQPSVVNVCRFRTG